MLSMLMIDITIIYSQLHHMALRLTSNLLPLILTTFVLLVPATAIISSVPGLHIDHMSLGLLDTSTSYLPTTYTNLSFAWNSPAPLPGVFSSGLTFNGFQLGINDQYLSFKAQLLDVTTVGAVFNLYVDVGATRVKYISCSVLVVTSNSYELELVSTQHPSADPTADIENITVPSSKFDLTVDDLWYKTMLQWVTGTGSIASSMYRLRIANSSVVGSDLQVQINSDSSHFIKQIKIVTLFMGKQVNGLNSAWFSSSQLLGAAHPSATVSFNLDINQTTFGKPLIGYHCLLFIRFLQMMVNSRRPLVKIDLTANDITGISINLVNAINFDALCLGVCQIDQFYNNVNNFCQVCSTAMNRCLRCTASNYCTVCPTDTLMSSSNNACTLCRDLMVGCQLCSAVNTCTSCFIGSIVVGGCSDVNGCVEVVQEMQTTGKLKERCVRCNTSYFKQNPVDGVCQCHTGHLAGQYCTTVVGCISTVMVNGTVFCSFCNPLENFKFIAQPQACICNDGYAFESGVCVPICGDGFVIDQKCDDGNLRDGDGCSSTCEVQIFYRCFFNSTTFMSSCQYVGPSLSITLISTQRNVDSHQGIFVFRLEPALLVLSNYNYQNYFSFQCNTSNHSVVDWAYSDGNITLKVDYFTDLQDQSVRAMFSFNQFVVRQSPIQLSFTAKSDGLPLIYEQQNTNFTTAFYVYLAIASLTLLVLVVGSFVSKMVGIELVSALQMIFYLQFLANGYTYGFQLLQELSFLGVSQLFINKNNMNLKLQKSYQKIQYGSAQAEVSILIIAGILLIVTAVSAILRVAYEHTEHRGRKGSIKKVSEFFWEAVVFPLSVCLFIPYMMMAVTESLTVETESSFLAAQYRALLLLIAIIPISLAFFSGLKPILVGIADDQKEEDEGDSQPMSSKYLPVYLSFLLCQSICLFFLFRNGEYFCLNVLLFLSVSMLLWHIIVRPYRSYLSNVSAILNVSLVIIFEVFVILKNHKFIMLNNEESIFASFIFAFFALGCTILSIIRTVRAIRNKSKVKKQRQVKSDSKKAKMNEKNLIRNEEMYLADKLSKVTKSKRKNNSENLKNALLDANNEVNIEEDEVLKRLKSELKEKFVKKKNKQRRVIEEVRENF